LTIFIRTSPTEIVIAGLDPAIRPFGKKPLRKGMDARVNPRINSGDAHDITWIVQIGWSFL
jgi:hypothetical protein